MSFKIRTMTPATAALALTAAWVPTQAPAQAIPGCEAEVPPIEFTDLTPKALEGLSIADIPLLVADGQLCVDADGQLVASDTEVEADVEVTTETPEQPEGDTNVSERPGDDVGTPIEETAEKPGDDVGTPIEETAETPGDDVGTPIEETAETPGDDDGTPVPDAPMVTAEPKTDLPEAKSGVEIGDAPVIGGETDRPEVARPMPETSVENDAPVAKAPETPAEDTGLAADTPAQVPEEIDGRPMAVAAGDETEGGASETTEVTVTEEDARSSDEDFAEAPDSDDGGLSNFE